MKTLKIACHILGFLLIILLVHSCNQKKETGPIQKTDFIDASQVRVKIEALGKQFSEEFKAKDSVALANFYTSDGMLGSVKGHDNLVTSFNGMIKFGSDNGTPNLIFITNSITTDDEFVIELGKAQWTDTKGNVKRESKYLVVWKQENGEWKIYRDWGL